MRHTYEYLDQCVAALEQINPKDITTLAVGEPLGRGSTATTYKAGLIGSASDSLPVALKFRHDGKSMERRLIKELAVAGLLTERVPSLTNALPRFAAMISVHAASKVRTGILTEDATQGGSQTVEAHPPSGATRAELNNRFLGERGMMAVFNEDELNNSVFFRVGDRERILDLTPGPFMWVYERQSPDYRRHYAKVDEVYDMGKLSLVADASSRLAATLPARTAG